MSETTRLPKIVRFRLYVCSETGDPGCMDCVEGICHGVMSAWVWAHRCTGCGGTDVYGQLHHDDDCPWSASTPAAGRPGEET
jgi:hypothetical protein